MLTTLVVAADDRALLARLPNTRVTDACGCGCATISFGGSDEPGGMNVVADAEATDAVVAHVITRTRTIWRRIGCNAVSEFGVVVM